MVSLRKEDDYFLSGSMLPNKTRVQRLEYSKMDITDITDTVGVRGGLVSMRFSACWDVKLKIF